MKKRNTVSQAQITNKVSGSLGISFEHQLDCALSVIARIAPANLF